MFTWYSAWILVNVLVATYGGPIEPLLRIVGGYDVIIEEIPYQVSLTRYQKFECGGSIITPRHVVTAAHCVIADLDPANYRVRAGSALTYQNGSLHYVVKIIPHENFAQRGFYIRNDISLLKVTPKFKLSAAEQPIPLLAIRHGLLAGQMTVVSGFGKTGLAMPASRKLMAINVPIIDLRSCRSFYARYNISLGNDVICAGVPDNSKNSCQGDSGGPLTYRGLLAGLVSWGPECTHPGIPAVYVNVGQFVEWIIRKLAGYIKRTRYKWPKVVGKLRRRRRYMSNT